MSEPRNEPSCPPEILDWLPWYADDALLEPQRGAVEAHAAQCETCRIELEMLRGGPAPSFTPPDPEPVFARVLARIEAEGMNEAPVVVGSHRAPAIARRAPALPRTRSTRALPRLAAAIALVLSAGAAGWFAHATPGNRGEAAYRTAADPAASALPAASSVQLDVVFRSDVGIERINTDLRALGAVVVSGPSQAGRYRVALPEGSDANAAAAMLRAEGRGVASFAEPLRP